MIKLWNRMTSKVKKALSTKPTNNQTAIKREALDTAIILCKNKVLTIDHVLELEKTGTIYSDDARSKLFQGIIEHRLSEGGKNDKGN